jgi:hypothetical protein
MTAEEAAAKKAEEAAAKKAVVTDAPVEEGNNPMFRVLILQ